MPDVTGRSLVDKESPWRVWITASAVAAVLLLPLLLVTYPPLQDLPNHLARLMPLRAAPGDPLLNYYEVDWRIIPNLGMDFVLLALGAVFPPALTAKLAFAFLAILWIVAPILLHRALYQRWSMLPLIGALFLNNRVVEMGFLNFWLGSSLVVIAAAIWIAISGRSLLLRTAAAIVIGALLFICHLAAFGSFLVVVTLWEIFAPREPGRPIADRLLPLAPLVAVGLLGQLLAPHNSSEFAARISYGGSNLLEVATTKWRQFLNFAPGRSLLGRLPLILFGSVVLLALVQRQVPQRLIIIWLALFGLFLVLPGQFAGGFSVDWRMLAPLVLVVSGSVRVALPRVPAIVLTAIVVAVLGTQLVTTTLRWRDGETSYRQFHRLANDVPVNSRLFYATIGSKSGTFQRRPSVLHFGSLAMLERHAVIPSLFATVGQHPLRIRSEYLTRHEGIVQIGFQAMGDVDWRIVTSDFDYVIIAKQRAPATPAGMTEIGHRGLFRLYRVNR